MGISRVKYNGQTLIDISSDSVTKEVLLKNYTAHDSNGEPVVGECLYDMQTTEFTASAKHIRKGYTAGVNKQEVLGDMPENEAKENTISTKEGVFEIPEGYHDGNGTVIIDPSAVSQLKKENIRFNVEILGVKGEMTGTEGENCSPAITVDAPLGTENAPLGQDDLIIQPEGDYTCFNKVTVRAVPYTTEDNTASDKGIWVTIG